ncbi:MAG: ThuA domain-containing protein, partial [Verrucomicrobiota bacterium]
MIRISCFLIALLLTSNLFANVDVLIVVGPDRHNPGTHECAAGGRVLKYSLENSKLSISVDLCIETWPTAKQRAKADTIVFIGDTFPANRMPNAKQNLTDLDEMMKRGCGIVCVHYATGLMGEDVAEDGDHPLLRWLGGYFANRSCPHHESFARIFPDAKIEPAADHEICFGWDAFTLHDEPYINNYFGKDENKLAPNVTALATSMLPPTKPKQETVAWCVDREDGGRGFGIVMPHFYKNWVLEDLRRFILNGIVWTAGMKVPADGVDSPTPVLADFEPMAKPKPIPANLKTEQLAAWCIVPFDAKKRGPEERAKMLVELGIKRSAYDWRAQHVEEFEEEILQYKKHGIEFFAFWSAHEKAFELFKKHDIRPQIWRMFRAPTEGTQEEKVSAAADSMEELAKQTAEIGSKLALYNHGGWSGEPENLVAVCVELRKRGYDHVGIVYNWHHAHDRIEDWKESLELMKPYLHCLNLNGMNAEAKPKILSLGQGQHELTMLKAVVESGYKGPVGII